MALVAGAAGGLGQVVSRDLAAHGWRLALVGSRREPLDALGAELEREWNLGSGGWMTAAADLRDMAATEDAVAEMANQLGSIDALVQVVGGYHGGEPVTAVRDAEVSAMLAQHLWTTLNLVRAAVPRMTEAGWGRVVAVSSPQASTPAKGVSPYAIGKAAQEALLATLAREVAGTGVTANVLLVRQIDVAGERDASPSPKNASWTTPEEIAAAIRFLLSDEAAAVNGARIPLFGNG